MNEKQLHELIIKHAPGLQNLKRTDYDQFCSYDAFNEKYVVEYKCRRKWYNGGTQLEKPKYDKNMALGKQYLYAVYDGKDHIRIWNVTKMHEAGYDFSWQLRNCPATTDFDRLEYIAKEVGVLGWDDCLWKAKVGAKQDGEKAKPTTANRLTNEEQERRKEALMAYIYSQGL